MNLNIIFINLKNINNSINFFFIIFHETKNLNLKFYF